MLRRLLALSMFVLWIVALVFAFFIGANVGARSAREQYRKQKRVHTLGSDSGFRFPGGTEQ